MLCKDCRHCKGVMSGYISTRFFCKIAPGDGYDGKGLGVRPWCNKPHPKCPLKNKKASC